MNRIIVFIFILSVAGIVEAKNLTVKTTDNDIAIVEKRKVSAEGWLQAAWDQQVAKSKEILIKEYVDKCLKNGTPIPATEAAILKEIIDKKETRTERDEREGQ